MIVPPTPSFSYKRPEQVRSIPLKASSYRGILTTTKIHLQNREPPVRFVYESGLERDLYYCLDHDYYCYDFQPQPLEFHWSDNKGNPHVSYPDCWAVFFTGKQILYQVKPAGTLCRLMQDEQWNQELEALTKYCKTQNWELKVVSELDIRTPRLQNITMLRGAVQHPPRESLIEETLDYFPSVFQIGIGKTLTRLTNHFSKAININTLSALHIAQYLLYCQVLSFDWTALLSKSTLIYPNLDGTDFARPFYEIQPVQRKNKVPRPVPLEIDLQALSPGQIDEVNQRYEAIKELLEKTDRTLADVQQKAKKLGIGTRTLYTWIKSYGEEQWRGLLQRTDRKGNRKPRFPLEVEEIIQQAITKHVKEQSSIKACWQEICGECKRTGIANPPVYHTVRARIARLPAKERKGKQGAYFRHEISQSVMGDLPTGEKPLNLIQMDHTLVDIVLVDQQFRRPVGRPWLTLAVDTYSRMVYGYFLSFNNPSSLSVTRTLMTGILPKAELLERFDLSDPYPVQGLPKRIQIDNSREFRSKHLEQFCQIYRIDLEFRPVRRPDKGAYIERLFGTVNRAIRDERLPGYAPPLKNRPENYNPDTRAEKAGLTLPGFEKWFLDYIVRTYHPRVHGGLKRSPLEQYQLGIRGLEGSLGANPIIPEDLVKLKFDILPISPKKHGVHAYGIRWLGNNYNAPVLLKMRKKYRGKPPKIPFRFDPADIRQVWVHDPDDKCYCFIPVTGGRLHRFVKKHPEMTVGFSEFQKVTKKLRKERTVVSPGTIEKGILERKELLEQARPKSKRARRDREKQKESTGVPRVGNPRKEKEKEKEKEQQVNKKVEIDWDKLTPLPSKPMGRPGNWKDSAPRPVATSAKDQVVRKQERGKKNESK